MTDKIAIVSASCLFPGAHSLAEYWDNLINGIDSRQDALASDFGMPLDACTSEQPEPNLIYSLRGGFIRDFEFDAEGYLLPTDYLAKLDSVFQWPLHCARQALDSLVSDATASRDECGVILGNYAFPTASSNRLAIPRWHREVAEVLESHFELTAGTLRGQVWEEPGKLANENRLVCGLPASVVGGALGLKGPQYSLDAACASAIYAMDLGCRLLQRGRADMMLVGGVCAPDPWLIHQSFSDLHAYPINGCSQPFSRRSQGICTGQGAAIVVLKRLSDAIESGDRIMAVIDGIGLSNDGAGKHLLTPNPSGQMLAYARAYQNAGVSPDSIDYVECHATGTPLGDATELESLEQFFGPSGHVPRLGSVKGNIGHLLTVAGMSSLIKVILAMEHGSIPATLCEDDSRQSPNKLIGADNIVRENEPWPKTHHPRRAAVSSWGFGGTNAHIILSEFSADQQQKPRQPHASRTLEIIGMGAYLGHDESVGAVEHRLFEDQTVGVIPSKPHMKVIEDATSDKPHASMSIDAMAFKIPPAELRHFNPQQLLMLQVADEALRDAGFLRSGGGVNTRKVGIVIVMELDLITHLRRARAEIHQALPVWLRRAGIQLKSDELAELVHVCKKSLHQDIEANEVLSYIGNIMASRIASLWNFNGPVLTLSADGNGLAHAIGAAQLYLDAGDAEAMLLGAVDLNAPTQGAGAIVLAPVNSESSQRSYAQLAGLDFVANTSDHASWDAQSIDRLRQSMLRALKRACVHSEAVDLIELANSSAEQNVQSLSALSGVYAERAMLSTAHDQYGDVGLTLPMLSLMRTALCLSRRYYPASREHELLPAHEFQRTSYALPWLRQSAESRRAAVISSFGVCGSFSHLVLQESAHPDDQNALRKTAPLMIALCADDQKGLMARLSKLRDQLMVESMNAEAIQQYHLDQYRDEAAYAIVLIARSHDELLSECTHALDSLPLSFNSNKPYQTPSGSYFSQKPQGPDARIALVYPGGFTSYPMQGRDLFLNFPEIFTKFEHGVQTPRIAMCERQLYPRANIAPTLKALMHVEEDLLNSIPSMLTLGTSFAILYTQLLKETLGISIHGAFGYSLGESSMMFANGVWPPSGRSLAALDETPLFKNRLTGRRTIVRDAWQLPDDLPDNQVWEARTLLAPVTELQSILKSFDRLFLTHINSPTESVVAGDPMQLEQLCKQIDGPSHRMPTAHVLHATIMRSEADALARLNHYPTTKPEGIELISGLDFLPIRNFEQDAVAASIARTLTETVDFRQLTESAYSKGYRIFIEVGTGGACTRWISSTLGERPHLSTYIDRRGLGATHSVLVLAAQLISHRIPVNLKRLQRLCKQLIRSHLTPVPIRGESIPERVRAGIAEITKHPVPPPSCAAAEPIPFSNEDYRMTDPTTSVTLGNDSSPHVAIAQHARQQTALIANALLTSLMDAAHQTQMRFLRSQFGLTQSMLRVNLNGALMPEEHRLDASMPLKFAPTGLMPLGRSNPTAENTQVVLDEKAILEFATGKVGAALGPAYAAIDQYKTRTRLPSPPYLFVSRVTKIDAERGRFEPCSLTTEYDIPEDAWYLVDGLMPPGVAVEAGQSDLLLIAYLGIDFENQGERVYRLLDGKLSFIDDLPRAGQTLRFDIRIDRFIRMGQTLLFFFSYDGYVNGKLALQLEKGCAGFFSAEELQNGMGVILDQELSMRSDLVKPMLRHDRESLTLEDILALSSGDIARVFGEHYQHAHIGRSLRLPPRQLLMIDQVTSLGMVGPNNSYTISAQKDLIPDEWYFTAHFPDDPVIPGSLIAEGATQLLKVHLLQLGMHHTMADAEFQPIPGLSMQIRVRGQVTPAVRQLRYEACILETGFVPRPFVRANIVVFHDERPLISIENLGLCIKEKPGTSPCPRLDDPDYHSGRISDQRDPVLLNEFHLAHAAKGNLEAAMGREFSIYNERRGPHIPNGDFQFVDRAIHVKGNRPNPASGDTMVTEYDVPADAWYFRQNAYPEAPNCVILETALQASILLGYFLGATLKYPTTEYSIRNLDGHARYVKRLDLRGKTIQHRERLMTHTATENAILQSYAFELLCEGEVFYQGESLFGYFSPKSLENQVGLDNGHARPFWHEDTQTSLSSMQSFDLRSEDAPPFQPQNDRPYFHLSRQQLNLLHDAYISSSGGRFGHGYVFGRRRIGANDWYFSRHFHRDPVMPGSLGVEAMYQAVQLYAWEQDLGRGFRNPRFSISLDIDTEWKYRGQILKHDADMGLEVHIKEVRRLEDRIDIIADGELYKGNLRIYEVKSLSVTVLDAEE